MSSADPVVGFATVKQAEWLSIRRRRESLKLHNDRDFEELAAALDIPEAQRSETLTALLHNLNDPEQTKAWTTADDGQTPIGNLTGLALSGGGIRSATFNLGVLQVLGWSRLFKHVDYLSTVSGGGYIGSCISSMFASLREFPFEHQAGRPEGMLFRHLRNNAEYLAPNGVVDYLRIPMTVIRGMIVNLLVVLPYLMIAAMITAAIHPSSDAIKEHWLRTHWPALPQLLGDSFVVSKCLLLLIAISFVLYPIVFMVTRRIHLRGETDWSARNQVGWFYSALILVTALIAFIEFQPVAVNWLIQHSSTKWKMLSGGYTVIQAAIPAALSIWLLKNAGRLAAKYVLTLLGISALLAFWAMYLWMTVALVEGDYAASLQGLMPTISVAVVLLAYSFLFVDLNYTSVHSFYRDRLSKAYVVKQSVIDGKPRIEPNDVQLLSKLNIKCAPYHLLNAAINLRVTEESYRRGRHADSFVFSANYVGSEPTGYCATTAMEAHCRTLNLATAMAISGAAAAPNMGKETNRLFAFFLAMLNVRLNYWLPNPRYAKPEHPSFLPRNPLLRVGPLYLLRELFGRLDERSYNINLSDGGHFENLGLYELIRRECRFIVCGDG